MEFIAILFTGERLEAVVGRQITGQLERLRAPVQKLADLLLAIARGHRRTAKRGTNYAKLADEIVAAARTGARNAERAALEQMLKDERVSIHQVRFGDPPPGRLTGDVWLVGCALEERERITQLCATELSSRARSALADRIVLAYAG